MTETFIVRPRNKNIVFVRTDSRRFFEIANRHIKDNGLRPKTVEMSASYVDELFARFGIKPNVSAKASIIQRFGKKVI